MRFAPPVDLAGSLRWIAFAFVVKLAYALMRTAQLGFFVELGGDTASYLDPIENLLSTGRYEPDFRMPGYGAFYLVLRALLSRTIALHVLVILQVMMDAVAVYLLAVVAARLFRSQRMFLPTYLLYLCSTYTSIFNTAVLSDSFAISSLIVALYLATKAIDERRPTYALGVGALLAWVVFMKPVMAPVVVLAMVWVGMATRDFGIGRRWLVAPLLVVLPLALVEGLWIARNYRVHDRFIPFTTTIYYPSYRDVDRSMFRFLQSWGGWMVHWDPKAEIVWFEYWLPSNQKIPQKAVDAVVFPPDIFTSQFSRESLLDIKQRLRRARDSAIPAAEREAILGSVSRDLDRYALSIAQERPFTYWVRAPARLLRQHLIHSGTYNLMAKPLEELSPPGLAFKLGMSALYLWVVVFGGLGLMLVVVVDRRSRPGSLVLAAIPAYVIFAHIFLLRLSEYRYFAPAYPFMLALAVRSSGFGLGTIRAVGRRLLPRRAGRSPSEPPAHPCAE